MDLPPLALQRTRGKTAPDQRDGARLLRIRRGFALDPRELPDTLKPWEARRLVAEARIHATAAAHEEVVLTRESALVLHGIPAWADNPDVWVRMDSRGTLRRFPAVEGENWFVPSARIRQDSRPSTDEPVVVDGITVDSLETTAVLCALSLHPIEGFTAACGIIRRLCGFNRFDIAESRRREEEVRTDLLRRLHSMTVKRGAKRANVILTYASGACESVGEAALLWYVLTVAQHDVETQVEVRADGRRYFADIAIPALGLILEFDGMGKLGGNEVEFARSRAAMMKRDLDLERGGWRVAHFQMTDFAAPDALRRRLAALVDDGGPLLDVPAAGMWAPIDSRINGNARRLQRRAAPPPPAL
ncbi:hypothetical protein M3T53_00245 [Actinomyces sp. B33]|uniref:hypothetical protein n=1 Tax=Actinomyces sp. B33 TaxID=2942131 RepID=UPI0023421462|nr:hypothetical protein [Actinomyces sp. B33]MDC4232152.1 hypothetical protein [Actinomyces sp. B33]